MWLLGSIVVDAKFFTCAPMEVDGVARPCVVDITDLATDHGFSHVGMSKARLRGIPPELILEPGGHAAVTFSKRDFRG